jgi:uncharacterized protein (TIGR03437 family)
MYLEIYGANFTSNNPRQWAGSDFNGLLAPTSLDGVSVKVNNKPAFVYFLSANQININAPDDDTTGPVTVQVFTPNGASNAVLWSAREFRQRSRRYRRLASAASSTWSP